MLHRADPLLGGPVPELSNEDLTDVVGGISGASCQYRVSGFNRCIQTVDSLQTLKSC